MGRSVSYPSNAEVAFTTFESSDEHFAADDFDMELQGWTEMAKSIWPSFYDDEKWLDREDRAVLSNAWARFGVSEYCGLVAIWIVAIDQDDASRQALADRWVSQAGEKLRKHFGELRRVGVFSNSEAVFERV